MGKSVKTHFHSPGGGDIGNSANSHSHYTTSPGMGNENGNFRGMKIHRTSLQVTISGARPPAVNLPREASGELFLSDQ